MGRSSRTKNSISMEKIQRSITRSNPAKTTAIEEDDDDLDLPHCLLFEVLLLLPLKSVFKFRLVSKRWLSVTSDPIFIRAYISRASFPPQWIALSPHVCCEKSFRPTLVLNHPSNSLELRVSYLRPPPPRPHRIRLNGWDVADRCSIAGASDGLVLYCYTSQMSGVSFFDFCVCDPFTGRGVRPLRRMTGSRLKPAWGFLARVDGRDFALKSYRIVHAVKKPGSVTFSVYYSETGAWSKFKAELGTTQSRRLELQESAAALEGVLYWADAGRGVVAFDPEAEPGLRARALRDPRGGERWRPPPPYPSVCVAHRGELRYFGWDVVYGDRAVGFRVWRLEGSGEWSLVHKVGFGWAMGLEMRCLHVTCFDPLDPNKAYLTNGQGRPAIAYDMERGDEFDDGDGLEIFVEGGFCACRFLGTHVLVVPPWPVRVSEKLLERRRGGRSI